MIYILDFDDIHTFGCFKRVFVFFFFVLNSIYFLSFVGNGWVIDQCCSAGSGHFQIHQVSFSDVGMVQIADWIHFGSMTTLIEGSCITEYGNCRTKWHWKWVWLFKMEGLLFSMSINDNVEINGLDERKMHSSFLC